MTENTQQQATPTPDEREPIGHFSDVELQTTGSLVGDVEMLIQWLSQLDASLEGKLPAVLTWGLDPMGTLHNVAAHVFGVCYYLQQQGFRQPGPAAYESDPVGFVRNNLRFLLSIHRHVIDNPTRQ